MRIVLFVFFQSDSTRLAGGSIKELHAGYKNCAAVQVLGGTGTEAESSDLIGSRGLWWADQVGGSVRSSKHRSIRGVIKRWGIEV